MKNLNFRLIFAGMLAVVSLSCFVFINNESARLTVDQPLLEYNEQMEGEEGQILLPDLELTRKAIKVIKQLTSY